jgi:hypothetical protein
VPPLPRPPTSWSSTPLLAAVYHAPEREARPRPDGEAEVAGRWLDVNATAEELGISTDAVRKRIARGSLESDRRDGHVLVWLDGSGTEAGHEASYLREQPSEERVARRRASTIIARLTQTNTQLSNRVLELDAPTDRPAASEPSGEAGQDAANGSAGRGAPPGPMPQALRRPLSAARCGVGCSGASLPGRRAGLPGDASLRSLPV